MTRVAEYGGFKFGQLVEARYQSDEDTPPGDWRVAVFAHGDTEDPTLPYAVKWGDEAGPTMYSYDEWIRPGNIRIPGQGGTAKRMQFRVVFPDGSDNGWNETYDGLTFYTAIRPDRIEFREAPARSAEEIVNKLREIGGNEISTRVYNIIRGEF